MKFHSALAVLALFSCPLPRSAPAAPSADHAPSHTELSLSYEQRRQTVLANAMARINADNPDAGSLHQVAQCLAAGEHLDWARHRLKVLMAEPTGAMFWMYPTVLVMKAGEANLNADDWAHLREAWRTYFPYRGDTENHWLMYYSSLFLAAETWPDLGPAGWFNGKSSAENRAEAKAYILEWMRITTSYGQGEYDSPNYIDPYLSSLALLTGWAQDEDLRHRAEMMMTYIIADYAVEQIGGNYGGAFSRLYPKHAMQPATASSSAYGWLLFGLGDTIPNSGAELLALTGYRPPDILNAIATDRSTAYEHFELKRTRWRMRHAGPEAIELDHLRTQPVYKYSYVAPDHVLGSTQGGLLQPIQQRTWSLVWHEDHPLGKANTFFALQPFHSRVEGTMYFAADADTVTDLIARSKVDYNSPDKLIGGSPYEQIGQYRDTLIGLYDIPAETNFPYITTFFSRDMVDRVEDESGWIFSRGGPTYIAYRPLANGTWKPANWTGLLAGGAGAWISSDYKSWGDGHDTFVSEHLQNGYVVQIASTKDFADYAAFQKAVKALPLAFSLDGTPRVTFTTLDGARLEAVYGKPFRINGRERSTKNWPLFGGPFLNAARESRRLQLTHGSESLQLDFDHNRTLSSVQPSAPLAP